MICPGTLRVALATLLLSLCGTATALPVLLEVLYDGPGADADDVFTEIAGSPGMAMDGWSLQGVNGNNGLVYRTVLLDGAVIPADGLLLVATASAAGEVLAARDFIGAVDWQNGPDAVQLLSPAGLIVDALQYGVAALLTAGEGIPAPDVAAGVALSRDVSASDTGDNATDFQALAPTPGTGFHPPVSSAAAVPEAPSLLLLGATLGLYGVHCFRRRGWARRMSQSSARNGRTPTDALTAGSSPEHSPRRCPRHTCGIGRGASWPLSPQGTRRAALAGATGLRSACGRVATA